MTKSPTASFKRRVAVALDDSLLRTNLARAMGQLRERRQRAFADTTDFPVLQAAARNLRRHTLRRLPALLEQLAEQVTAQGGTVFWAEDAAAANQYIVALAQARRARTVVKSRSIIGEEIGLRAALEAGGLAVLETQLGDYILQLDDDHPSHVAYPALHRRKEDVAILFEEKLDMPETLNVQAMAGMARFKQRRAFQQADLGIGDATFAVAETGTLALMSDGGSDRIVASLPPVHVALMAIDRVVPRLEDLFLLLQLLAQSAAGHTLANSVSLLTGPARHEEPDGARERHLVIVDNGRSELLAAGFGEALACIDCGACTNVCPVHLEIGGRAYGNSAPGPIGSVTIPLMPLPPASAEASVGDRQAPEPPGRLATHQLLRGTPFADLPHASTLCGACADVCPVGIDIPALLLKLRGDLHRAGRASATERLGIRFWAWAMADAARYRTAGRLLAFGGRLLGRNRIRRLPPPFHGWSRTRDFPRPAAQPFRTRFANRGGS